MRLEAIADDIRNTVSIRQAFERYGIDINNHGYAICPFHNEKTASCKIYNDSFHCFGCGADGNVITFVMKFFNLSFVDSVKKLDTDFCLNLPIGERMTPRQAFDYRRLCAQIESERIRRANARAENSSRYCELTAEFTKLERFIKANKPTADEPIADGYFESLRRKEYIGYLLDNWEWSDTD